MTRPRRPSPLLDEITPALHAYAHTLATMFNQPAEDFFQVAYERALTKEPTFDPSRGVTFLTYVWRAVTGAALRYATKNMPPEEAEEWDALVDAAASQVEAVSEPVNVMYDVEERLVERAGDMRCGVAASMAFAVAGESWARGGGGEDSDPEAAYERVSESRRVRDALHAAIAAVDEKDRELVRRVGLGGEELKAVLRGMPEWSERPYVSGWKHYGKVLERLGERMWIDGGVSGEDAVAAECG